ncbi:hypothetical protein [Nostoc parmelioides]|uniref:Uncharacterized protein n=1 Tax=Nostoc parmelioides FACHB-3921 TaxID=2692909 RepID=A0ABR8BPQ2_9NOSO|nr:hypothetical protein [Nostoc parmelioides]MBD2255604.1 hypothetical protein [Nostoc parmelioides FACHB-3921]
MTRTTKTKTATDSNTMTIAAAVKQLKTNEQALRLALIDIRPDDFDSTKTLSSLDFEAVAKKLEQQQQLQLPAHTENLESYETPTQQALETATHEPPKSTIVPQASQQHLTNSAQSPTPNSGLSLVEMVAKQATEEIAAVDGILQVRNALVLNNLAVRDAELAEGINQRWQGQKQGYVGVIRDLAGLAQESPQFTPDTTDINAEINSVLGKLNSVA